MRGNAHWVAIEQSANEVLGLLRDDAEAPIVEHERRLCVTYKQVRSRLAGVGEKWVWRK